DNVKRRLAGEKPVYNPLRLRTMIYAALILVVGGAMVFQLATRRTIEMSVLHDRAPLFVMLSDGAIRNAYTIRILNKRPDERPVALTVHGLPGIRIEAVGVAATADLRPVVSVAPDSSREVRVLVTLPPDIRPEKTQTITFTAADLFAGEMVTATDHFIAP
ncbi:MAG: cytochrome c oxidase accessory protein CcoG, partial [Beijerinckiaceae bacterium]|nr:cytochrome c oxidase accessory protein CcoG [Beijerinckiaceae bacterium]